MQLHNISLRFVLTLAMLSLVSAAPFIQAQEPTVPEPTLATPRDTIKVFVGAMGAARIGKTERLSQALACLDMSQMDEVERNQKGAERARQLFEVLSTTTFKLDQVDDPSGRTFTFKIPTNDIIQLRFRRDDQDQWRITPETLDHVLDWHVEYVQSIDPEALEGVDPLLRSPRATMMTFVSSVKDDGVGAMDRAVGTLDLSNVESMFQGIEGEPFAKLLMEVLDKHGYIFELAIPNNPQGEPYIHLERPEGMVVIAPTVDPNTQLNAWRFTTNTLDGIRALREAYKEQEYAEDVESHVEQSLGITVYDWIEDNAPWMLREVLFLQLYQWLGLFVIILLGMVVSRVLTWILTLIIKSIFRRQKLHADAVRIKDFVRPIRIALMAWVWLLGLYTLDLPPDAFAVLMAGAGFVSVAAGVWAAYRMVDVVGNFLTERAAETSNTFDDLLAPLVVRSLKIFTVVIGVVVFISQLGLELTPLLTGLGLGGLAFALAAKDTVSNIFGSLTILLDRPFAIGDWIQIGDVDGSVESVGIRSTRVRTFYNSVITVPNSEMINATIDNYGARRYRRIKTMLGLTYDTPPEKIDAFCEGIRQLIRDHPYTRKDYYHVYLNEFADSSLNVLLYCFHEAPDWSTELRERHRLFNDIIRLAQRLEVEFAFPTQTLYMQSGDETQEVPEWARASDTAMRQGRYLADDIVAETLGRNAPVPPPVSFANPDDEDTPLRDAKKGGE
jgi:MscS family membrane protein